LLSRVDIVELISGSVSLRKTGSNYVARCPFHEEETPSFSVSQTKQFYHCFGCGKHGDALQFLMEFHNLPFVDAAETLAARVGMALPRDNDKGEVANYQLLYEVLQKATEFFERSLRLPIAHNAVAYLKKRGVSGRIAKNFALGFAPSGWDNLYNELKNQGYKEEQLLATGLLVQNENGRCYDRFRDRVIFPIRDGRGRVLGFGGRVLGDEKPKYLNSPETVLFNKGSEVYGLYEARTRHNKLTRLVVVEGYMDVVALAQQTEIAAVATLGTALTEKHLDILWKYSKEVIFCFDGDKAGREAAKRALNCCLPSMKDDRRAHFAFLPENEDPDTFVRTHGVQAFEERLARALPFSDFFFKTLSLEVDIATLEGKAEFMAMAEPLIRKMPKGALAGMMQTRLSQMAGVATGHTYRSANRPFQAQSINREAAALLSPALRALSLLLQHRHFIAMIGDLKDVGETDIPGAALLCEVIEILKTDPKIDIEALCSALPGDYGQQLSVQRKSLLKQALLQDGAEEEWLGALKRLRQRVVEQTISRFLMKAKKVKLSVEETIELNALLQNKDVVK